MMMGWWDLAGWPTAEQWSALWALGAMLATFGTVLVGLGTLIVAGVAAWAALRQLRAYIAEQEEQARPYLVVDFWFKSNTMIFVSVENISSTPATDVTLRADPMVRSTRTTDGRNEALAEVFGGRFVIPQIAPGRVMRWYVDSNLNMFNITSVPHRFEVTASYNDPRGRVTRSGELRRYSDVFVLDLDAFGEASAEENYEHKMWQLADANERRLEVMAGSLASVASTLDTLLGIDEAAKAARRREPMLARRRRRQEGRA
ncbi:hypothetical protein [Agromyces sp. CCNWLW203]|uniref:hypothetical protein n=1 Tax=Agromyces sp. CCNWLW203 TaxID=3112842 RepID=UPI002F968203